MNKTNENQKRTAQAGLVERQVRLDNLFDLEKAKNGEEFEILIWDKHPDDGQWISIFDYCKERDDLAGFTETTSYKAVLKNLRVIQHGEIVVVDDWWINALTTGVNNKFQTIRMKPNVKLTWRENGDDN